MSRGRFEPLLLDICKHQLKLNVYAKSGNKGMRIFNLALRDANPKYDVYPSIVEVSSDKEKYKSFYGVTLDEPAIDKQDVNQEVQGELQ